MARTETERKEIEMVMYGMSEEAVKNERLFKTKYMSGDLMYAMSILSDAQEVMEHGDTETARKFINKAKYWISETQDKLREAGK